MDEPPPEVVAAITAKIQLLDARLADPEKAISLIESQEPPSGGLAWSNIPPGL